MADTTRGHWTSDEELLEQFVAGRVPAAHRQALEDHLRTCAQCRAAVTDERLMTEGIRAAGRAELRRDLTQRLGRRSGSETSGVWRWMAAAAVLVATVGVWRWLTPLNPAPELPPAVAEQPAKPQADAAEPETSSAAGESTPAPFARFDRRARREVATTADSKRPQEAPAAGAGVSVAEAPSEVMADAVSPERAERMIEVKGELALPNETMEAWVEATVLPHVVQNAQKIAMRPSEARDEEVKEKGRPQAQSAVSRGPAPVQLRQMSRDQMPASQQMAMALADRRTVPVRITSAGDSLVLELYPVSLYPESEMTKAIVQRPKADSLVVLIGGQLLGVRIPESFRAR